ncbi:MAG: beta-phosphoglucomutase [Clostridia bacterium]|nr:beta-phosphoglucomutase [Clostridia bacterium]
MTKKYKAVIFDLDGVIVSTDECHYEAWKMLADEEGIYFDREINQRLRGVSRMESLEIVLERATKEYTEAEKLEMATRKNGYYVEKIKSLDKTAILAGALEFVSLAKNAGLKVAIGSSSKNTMAILKQTGCETLFDAIADGNDIKNSKPAPDVFLVAAEKLQIAPTDCMVVEDAEAGVDAALAAGMDVLAVGFASAYAKATYRAKSLDEVLVKK